MTIKLNRHKQRGLIWFVVLLFVAVPVIVGGAAVLIAYWVNSDHPGRDVVEAHPDDLAAWWEQSPPPPAETPTPNNWQPTGPARSE